MVATLVVGLSENSRIKRKITGAKLTLEQTLLAMLTDEVNIVIWQRTKDGQRGKNRPESIYKKLMGLDKKKQKEELKSFETAEDFERWYKAKMR